MSLARTFTLYVGQRFLGAFLLMLLALTLLVSLFDFVELLRRAAGRPEASFAVVANIAALRIPFIALQIMPFALLLGGLLAFWRLARGSELIVARASGISAFAFLVGPVLVALLAGVLAITAVSPLSSALFSRAERLEASFLRAGGGVTALAGGMLWLRQADRGIEADGVAILTGRPARLLAAEPGAEFRLDQVSVWRLTAQHSPLQRIEAQRARLVPGHWVLEDLVIFQAGRNQPIAQAALMLPTALTAGRIEDSVASPGTLSFWALPDFITLLEQSGFSALRHRLQFQGFLSLPLLAVAMALLAAGFSMRHSRQGGAARGIAAGVATGFGLFVLARVTAQFGEAGSLPVWLAAWAPTAAGLLLALTLLLHLEEG